MTGAGGLLGGRLAALLDARGHEVLAACRRSLPPAGPRAVPLDLTDTPSLAAVLDGLQPEAVVHSAALGVERCEEHPDEAERVNALLPGTLARLCRERGLRLVSLSTDLVFAGDRSFAAEDDPPRPLSAYGRSKLAGEEAVLEAHPAAAVVRVPLVLGRGHGPRGTSSESIVWAARAGRAPRLFVDEHRTPLDPESVADAIDRLLACPAAGRFHLGGPERLSRYELGRRVARAFGLPEDALVPARQAEHRGPDRRPADVSMDSARARRELGWEPRPIDDAIREGRTRPE